MPRNAPAKLWISQACSDRLASTRVYSPGDTQTYCQTLAKYQQVVEKCVKAIVSATEEAGIYCCPMKYLYDHDVDKLITGLLTRLPGSPRGRDILSRVSCLFSTHRKSAIKALSDLAPSRPPQGQLHTRNTEYPYERSAGDWIAPAAIDAFSQNDVQRFMKLADSLFDEAQKIISAVRRSPSTV